MGKMPGTMSNFCDYGTFGPCRKGGGLRLHGELHCRLLSCDFGNHLVHDVFENLDLRFDVVDSDYAANLEVLIQSSNFSRTTVSVVVDSWAPLP